MSQAVSLRQHGRQGKHGRGCSLPDREPTLWERLTSNHPIAERMHFGLDWAAMNQLPAVRPEPRPVPDAAPVAAAP